MMFRNPLTADLGRRGADLRNHVQVHQSLLSDLLQQRIQIRSLALAELSLLFGELGSPCRLLLRLLGLTHHLLHQLAAALGQRLLGLRALVRPVVDDFQVQAVSVAVEGLDGDADLRREEEADVSSSLLTLEPDQNKTSIIW